MPQSDTPSTPELFRTLWRALPDLFRSNPWAVSALISVSIVRGLLPALTILSGRWTVWWQQWLALRSTSRYW